MSWPLTYTDIKTVEAGVHSSLYGDGADDPLHLYMAAGGGFREAAWRQADYRAGSRTVAMIAEEKPIERIDSPLQVWYERALYDLALGRPLLAEHRLRDLRRLLTEDDLRQRDQPEQRRRYAFQLADWVRPPQRNLGSAGDEELIRI